MIWSISWRNVWRSRLRSIIILTAISLGVFAGVFAIAFMYGWINQRIDAVINTEVTHIQIHHKNYIETNEVKDNIPNIYEVQKNIQENDDVEATSARVLVTAMAASAETGSGVMLTGINPDEEMLVSNIHTKIIDGAYFEGVKRNPIVIGQKLADKLKVKVRSKIVITVNELDGTITGGAFRVAGIFKTSNTTYDEMKAFVRADDLRNLIKLDSQTGHELAILLNENGLEDQVKTEIINQFPDFETLTWEELLPEMRLMNESMGYMMYIFIIIILLALGFGIVNTMLMVILERVKELGMLMAIGMNKKRVFKMIVLETVFISLTGGIIGIAIGLGITFITGNTGLDLSMYADGLNSAGFNSIIYPQIEMENVVVVTFLVILTGIVSALYPAKKAIKLNPADALKIDM